jgi:hypothetical protein
MATQALDLIRDGSLGRAGMVTVLRSMSVDLVEAQRVLAELLVDPGSLAAWEADRRVFSRSRLTGPEASMGWRVT